MSGRPLTEDQFLHKLDLVISMWPTQCAFAKSIDYSCSYVSDVVRRRRTISKEFARSCGLAMHTTFTRIEP